MMEIWQNIIQVYSQYMGSGMMGGLFFVAVLYLFLGEKESVRKWVLAVVPAVLFALFACPLFAWLVYRYLDDEVYYRFLWLMPMTIVIAYAGVKLVLHQQGFRRLVMTVAVSAVLMLCGNYVYDNAYYTPAENAYHVPGTVADICEEIMVEGREVKAVFPAEMVQYVRQYTPFVCMPYGREMIVERWITYNEMYEVYELGLPTGTVEAGNLADTSRRNGVHYIIWDKNRVMDGDLTDHEFALKNEIEGYLIYVDKTAYLGL